jgi:iron(III) transport system ATP-binding protein
VTFDAEGLWSFAVEGWSDPLGTWWHDAPIKVDADVDVEVVLRPHEVALAPAARRTGPGPEVIAVEYHGAFVLHTVRLASGRTLRSWQQHAVRYPVGTPVVASVVAGVTPTLLVGDSAVVAPPAAPPVS